MKSKNGRCGHIYLQGTKDNMSINRPFIAQALTFVVYAASASFSPFLALILADKGLSPAEAGTVISAVRVVMFIVTPLWCFIADKIGRRATVLTILSMGSAAMMYIFYICIDIHLCLGSVVLRVQWSKGCLV